MLNSILVANRGEIARRVIRTAKAKNIRSIAVYSDADKNALHVEDADEARHIGPSDARESYLSINKILAAAHESGAEAIHPGYGFLSENADFADAVAQAGLTFIGPPAEAIRQMADKSLAKQAMAEAGIPVLPGYHGNDQSDETLLNAAIEIGFPVLLKAAAGGGGRGIRLVEAEGKFLKNLKAARREALSSFGDDRMLVERFVQTPRHIEVQIFADGHGNVVHLFERECSIQRRYQKIIEEAPAPGVSPALRAKMGQVAIDVARAVNYRGAGTVEFIADATGSGDDMPFYFMEMNTRLQVEHPVTEMITGIDLVDWQFQIAAGGQLPLQQSDLQINGNAIEARLYAENPAKKFMPQPGMLDVLQFPPASDHLRIENGAREGDEVTIYYDPMIAKIVTWGPSRLDATSAMAKALDGIDLQGIQTNLAFLGKIVSHPAYAAGKLDTGFVDRHFDDLIDLE
jgi:3-methylcrotonyl-CoA carboxylase alpha subunit